ncbi:MAG: hypothetical protein Q8L49_03120 [Burkholderiaceae bacterium]|nr:hypothetical protein [Burkholderiaceae bacterium]
MQDVSVHETVWVLSLTLMAVVATIFAWVVAGAARGGVEAAPAATTAYRWRAGLFWVAAVAGVLIAAATLAPWPIPGHARGVEKADLVVQAKAHQWRWELSRDSVPVGKVVEFELTADDVNHGFALYRGDRLIAQTQAMPGFTNRLRVRFDAPGEYRVLCLEYCGVGHHAMRAVINAVAAQ